jgi:hypothetical protein
MQLDWPARENRSAFRLRGERLSYGPPWLDVKHLLSSQPCRLEATEVALAKRG